MKETGVYHSRSRAAYWDGRNHNGEAVASGIYFYRLMNADGVVNILDLVIIASAMGEHGIGLREDVNADEVVNIQDLVAVAHAMGKDGE